MFAENADAARKLFTDELSFAKEYDISHFSGKCDEVFSINPPTGSSVIITAFDAQKNLSPESIMRSTANAIHHANGLHKTMVDIIVPDTDNSALNIPRWIIESVFLSNHSPLSVKTIPDKNKLIEKVSLISSVPIPKSVFTESKIVCENTLRCRDLVNRSSDDVNPETVAEEARKLSKLPGIKVDILNTKKIEKLGMGLLSAVGRGGKKGARLVVLTYTGVSKKSQYECIVGKGITFDSGGYNLKPTGSMEDMRSDMAGAATALYTIRALSELRAKVNVCVVLPLCENLIGRSSYRPGDVFRSYDGRTVEVANTDAEGRLILADAISYANKRFAPSSIITMATLTGSCVMTFAHMYAALITTEDTLAARLIESSERTGEKIWRLPYHEDYDNELDSDIADMRNVSGDKKAGAIIGGCFVRRFAKKTPFAHIDIAGTSWTAKATGCIPKYATGYGVRLMTDFLTM